MNCSNCGDTLASEKRSSSAIMGTCPDCRGGKYDTCPSCRNWTLSEGQDPATCLVCVTRARFDGKAIGLVPMTGVPDLRSPTPKVYKSQCPCGICWPATCDYHQIKGA